MEVIGKPWRECFPAAHHSVRNTPNRKMGLSPFEVPFWLCTQTRPLLPTDPIADGRKPGRTCHAVEPGLGKGLQKVFLIPLSDADRDLRTHNLKPGDYGVVKRHQRESLEPR
ncbi:hypothetical protein GDO81_027931 [Engystomops pustulosus]|uniref:Uncharacterized protein n=1 Tax=Engystomops pustulosus TaxID=76066 RepID=A0AAV6YJ90_ENGPU|nr:hypothetical protein GDO81_027931 [Engystomops pustulosus]